MHKTVKINFELQQELFRVYQIRIPDDEDSPATEIVLDAADPVFQFVAAVEVVGLAHDGSTVGLSHVLSYNCERPKEDED